MINLMWIMQWWMNKLWKFITARESVTRNFTHVVTFLSFFFLPSNNVLEINSFFFVPEILVIFLKMVLMVTHGFIFMSSNIVGEVLSEPTDCTTSVIRCSDFQGLQDLSCRTTVQSSQKSRFFFRVHKFTYIFSCTMLFVNLHKVECKAIHNDKNTGYKF